jgi:flagellar P-ring protein FlgI
MPSKMPKFSKIACLWAVIFAALTPQVQAASRIKDIVNVENVRDNQLIGYGLVVGLKGTGDTLRRSPFTQQSLAAMLERLGVNTRSVNLNTENVAAVSVTANLPPFSRKGSRIDVTVSALGDAENLQGGTLLVTPLIGLDGQVYAMAQGNLAVSGFNVRGQAESVSRGVTTSGRIGNGAIVEREINFDLSSQNSIHLSLKNPDFTTAQRISQAINGAKGANTAKVLDPSTVLVTASNGNAIQLLTDIEQLPVSVDQPARVVIDEASGTIVMGADVKVSRVAIAQGNLTIRVTEVPQVSQPAPFSRGGETVVVPRTNVQIDDSSNRKMAVLQAGVSLQDLVNGLNALGVGPRDMITILQALKTAGALQADLDVY